MDLSLDFCGRELVSPLGVGSQALFSPGGHRISSIVSLLEEYVESGAGFVCTPCIRSGSIKGPPATGRFQVTRIGREVLGFFSIAERQRIQLTRPEGSALISELKQRLPSTPIVANIVAESGASDEWVSHALEAERAGASFIEINPSCPLPTGGSSTDYDPLLHPQLGDDAQALAEVVGAVASALHVPVGLKVSGEWGLRQLLATHAALVPAGLTFSTNVNAPLTVAPPDLRRIGAGRYPGLDENPLAAATGPWVRFLAYRNIAALHSYFPRLQTAGVGGVTSAENSLELILLGAKVVQLSSSLMIMGRQSVRAMTAKLKSLLVDAGIPSLADAQGKAGFKNRAVSDWGLGRLRVVIDENKCTRCGACAGSLCKAIDGSVAPPRVNQSDCGLCGLCLIRCREGAIQFRENLT